jgi:hypothetical protein
VVCSGSLEVTNIVFTIRTVKTSHGKPEHATVRRSRWDGAYPSAHTTWGRTNGPALVASTRVVDARAMARCANDGERSTQDDQGDVAHFWW